ncbi:rhodanese-like domain-containing protein [Thiolinea disciformis]|uniref:rhodanese-like domain-containing protein n=1 Tax=Thiolinea disciformis TaxID=125614 RepID=UPI000368CF6F|nr:rhodanese-like domain-containing protein [Thiolinea disciformis]
MYGIKEIDARGLRQMLDEKKPVRLIDVRTDAEFRQGIIEGAEFMPLHLLPVKATEFSKDDNIVFYCRSGARSAQACMFLQQQTGVEAINLRGGIINWYQSGYNIVQPNAA